MLDPPKSSRGTTSSGLPRARRVAIDRDASEVQAAMRSAASEGYGSRKAYAGSTACMKGRELGHCTSSTEADSMADAALESVTDTSAPLQGTYFSAALIPSTQTK